MKYFSLAFVFFLALSVGWIIGPSTKEFYPYIDGKFFRAYPSKKDIAKTRPYLILLHGDRAEMDDAPFDQYNDFSKFGSSPKFIDDESQYELHKKRNFDHFFQHKKTYAYRAQVNIDKAYVDLVLFFNKESNDIINSATLLSTSHYYLNHKSKSQSFTYKDHIFLNTEENYKLALNSIMINFLDILRTDTNAYSGFRLEFPLSNPSATHGRIFAYSLDQNEYQVVGTVKWQPLNYNEQQILSAQWNNLNEKNRALASQPSE
ncbi:MAG: hypothetical protein M9962_05765 [Oligoflexia bacterium]|nr:hypothetical protein [Oligoflexia bacterium]